MEDFLRGLAEVAVDEFDCDRGISSRELYRSFLHYAQNHPVNLTGTDKENLIRLLDMLDAFVNRPEWELNNKELLRDEYNYFVRSGGRFDL